MRLLPLAAASTLTLAALAVAPSSDAGSASPLCEGRAATQVVTAGADGSSAMTGTDGDDVVVIDAGTAFVDYDGLGGDDLICVLAGAHDVHGGAGDDRIVDDQAEFAPIELFGDDDDDQIVAHQIAYISGGNGDDTITGSPFSDGITPGPGEDTVDAGGQGNLSTGDTWYPSADAGPLTIDTRTGVVTGDGTDQVTGIESFVGTPGADTFVGSPGDDGFGGGGGADQVSTGAGDDQIGVSDGATVLAGPGRDTLYVSGPSSVHGGRGDDMITVDSQGGAHVFGDRGNDTITDNGLRGRRDEDGGPGTDTFFLEAGLRASRNMIDARPGHATTDSLGANIRLSHFDIYTGRARSGLHLMGSDAADVLIGSGRADVIEGGKGDDRLLGEGGDDTITGGPGRDVANGGAGKIDRCVAEVVKNCEK